MAKLKYHRCYCILNANVTVRFCYDFYFSFPVLWWSHENYSEVNYSHALSCMYSIVPIKRRSFDAVRSCSDEVTKQIMTYSCRVMLQMKQDTDDFIRVREQTTQPSIIVRQQYEIDQFDVHNLTFGLGPVADLSAGDGNESAISVRDSSHSLVSTSSSTARRLVLCRDVWSAVVSA